VRLRLAMWFGLLGAPAAWSVQFLVGYGISEAACGAASAGGALDPVTAVATATAAVVALLAGAAAVLAWRETREAEGQGGADEAPPLGRIHFLATVGIVITPLFLAIILMSGIGAILLPECRQS
jgi:hypothetical protein